jgi:hypothetical protein
MKSLIEIINEKLKISKGYGNFNPDETDSNVTTIYDSTTYKNEDEEYIDLREYKEIMKQIEKDIDGFLLMNEPISKSKNIENDIDNVYIYLDDIIDKVITGKDYGYRVRIDSGHIEIDCINSGSSNTYYIYGLSRDGQMKLEEWFADEGEYSLKDLLFDENNYVIINIDKYLN